MRDVIIILTVIGLLFTALPDFGRFTRLVNPAGILAVGSLLAMLYPAHRQALLAASVGSAFTLLVVLERSARGSPTRQRAQGIDPAVVFAALVMSYAARDLVLGGIGSRAISAHVIAVMVGLLVIWIRRTGYRLAPSEAAQIMSLYLVAAIIIGWTRASGGRRAGQGSVQYSMASTKACSDPRTRLACWRRWFSSCCGTPKQTS